MGLTARPREPVVAVPLLLLFATDATGVSYAIHSRTGLALSVGLWSEVEALVRAAGHAPDQAEGLIREALATTEFPCVWEPHPPSRPALRGVRIPEFAPPQPHSHWRAIAIDWVASRVLDTFEEADYRDQVRYRAGLAVVGAAQSRMARSPARSQYGSADLAVRREGNARDPKEDETERQNRAPPYQDLSPKGELLPGLSRAEIRRRVERETGQAISKTGLDDYLKRLADV